MDQQALITLLSPTGTGHKPLRLHREADRHFTPVYRPGSQNVADFLSRSVSGPTEEFFDEPEVLQLLTSPFDQVITLDELKYVSNEDEVLQRVRNYIVKGWPKKLEDADVMSQPFFNIREELSSWNDACVARGERAVVPSALRQRVLCKAHEGHLGVVKTKQLCRSSVWWPRLDHQIEEFSKDCEACVLSGKSGHSRPGPLQVAQGTLE